MAAKTLGAGDLRIMLRHILPNVIAPVIVVGTLYLGYAIMIEATMSFLGLGVQPPTPSWGLMITQGRSYMRTYPLLTIFPGLAIMLTVFGFNLLGDVLRDILDPRSKKLVRF